MTYGLPSTLLPTAPSVPAARPSVSLIFCPENLRNEPIRTFRDPNYGISALNMTNLTMTFRCF